MKNIITLLFLSIIWINGLTAQNEKGNNSKIEFQMGLGTNYSNNYISLSTDEYLNPFKGNYGIQLFGGITYKAFSRVNLKLMAGYQLTRVDYNVNATISATCLNVPVLVEFEILDKLSVDVGFSYVHVFDRIAPVDNFDDAVIMIDRKNNFVCPQIGLNYMFSDRWGINFNTQFMVKNIYNVPVTHVIFNQIREFLPFRKNIYSLSILYKIKK